MHKVAVGCDPNAGREKEALVSFLRGQNDYGVLHFLIIIHKFS